MVEPGRGRRLLSVATAALGAGLLLSASAAGVDARPVFIVAQADDAEDGADGAGPIGGVLGSHPSVSGDGRFVVFQGAPEVPDGSDLPSDPRDNTVFLTDRGVVCQFNSSWCVRVRRDELFTMQVDGTNGSAMVGLRNCFVQSADDTPKPVWNPDIDSPINFFDDWTEVRPGEEFDNAFKTQWELFLKHVARDEPFPWSLREGAKGVQLAELSWESVKKGSWVEVA